MARIDGVRPDDAEPRVRAVLDAQAARYGAPPSTDRDVDDALFARVREAFYDDAIVELTATIAWENASSTFNRALRIGSQHFWNCL